MDFLVEAGPCTVSDDYCSGGKSIKRVLGVDDFEKTGDETSNTVVVPNVEPVNLKRFKKVKSKKDLVDSISSGYVFVNGDTGELLSFSKLPRLKYTPNPNFGIITTKVKSKQLTLPTNSKFNWTPWIIAGGVLIFVIFVVVTVFLIIHYRGGK